MDITSPDFEEYTKEDLIIEVRVPPTSVELGFACVWGLNSIKKSF